MIPYLTIFSVPKTFLTFWILSSISCAIAWPSAQINLQDDWNSDTNDASSRGNSNSPQEEAIFVVNENVYRLPLTRTFDINDVEPNEDISLAHIVQAPPGYACFFWTPNRRPDGTEYAARISQTFYSPRTPDVTAASDATNIVFPAAQQMTCFVIPNPEAAKETIGLSIEYPFFDLSDLSQLSPRRELNNMLLLKFRVFLSILQPDEEYGQAAFFHFEDTRLESLALVHDLGSNTMCTIRFENNGRMAEENFTSSSGLIGPFDKIKTIVCYRRNA